MTRPHYYSNHFSKTAHLQKEIRLFMKPFYYGNAEMVENQGDGTYSK